MSQTAVEPTERAIQPATAKRCGVGSFPLGSLQSRAAARALLNAREATKEQNWDGALALPVNPAETIAAVRRHAFSGEDSEMNVSPINIPPGKENTVRGRHYARINAARARLATDRKAKQ